MTNDSTAPHLSQKGIAALDALLASTVDAHTLPALTWGVTTATGPLYFATRGDRVWGDSAQGQIDEDTILQLYSQTKLVVAVAALQLVDRGVWSLDDPAVVEKHAPELWAQEILSYDDNDNEVYTPRKTPLTLRHLLNHTSGLAYPFSSPVLGKWAAAHKLATQRDPEAGLAPFTVPLLFEPGTQWRYSVGIDWVGAIIERVTGSTLEDYFQKNIWQPLGIKSITFNATAENIAKLQVPQARVETDGGVTWVESHGSLRDLTPGVVYKQASGGGGLLGTARDYLSFLAAILRSREEPSEILTPAGYAELFTNSLGERRDDNDAYAGLAAYAFLQPLDKGLVANNAAGLGFSVGLGLALADTATGRKKGSGHWGGIAKTGFWLDPATGIAAIIGTQIFTPGVLFEPAFNGVYAKFERTLYDALE
ncbi:hypothetical protein Q8F55_003383 [Vanrija albida]|uniref:Beta-lactamase-related domain-containing protein n=1 Tax=Vanrija albida TaxID=181172 RepID=A0ABR3Q426_9TREE